MKIELYENGSFVREVSTTFPNCVELGNYIVPVSEITFWMRGVGFENPSIKIKGDDK